MLPIRCCKMWETDQREMMLHLRLSLVLFLMILSACTPPASWQVTILAVSAQAHAQRGQYDQAIADLDSAIELMPNSPALYIQRGQMHVYLYQWDRALAEYQQAITLDPLMSEAYYYRAILYATRNEPALALADFERYLSLEPSGVYAEQSREFIRIIQAQQDALGN